MIEKCMNILACISETQGNNSLSIISEKTNIPRSTVHRILRSMIDNKMIVQQRKGGYIVSNSLLRMCLEGTGNSNLLSTLIPLVDEIKDKTHETVSINIMTGMERMCIYRAEGDFPITRMVMIGSRSPLFFGAAGRIFAAYLNDEKLAKALDYAIQNNFVAPADRQKCIKRAREDKENGFAVSIQERYAGCGSIAVPIKRLFTGEVIATISISALASRIEDTETQSKYLNLLLCAAEEGNSKFLM